MISRDYEQLRVYKRQEREQLSNDFLANYKFLMVMSNAY